MTKYDEDALDREYVDRVLAGSTPTVKLCGWCDKPATVATGTPNAACSYHALERVSDRRLVLVGKQGPAFGDGRPSSTTLLADYGDGTSVEQRVTNWPRDERGDALRAAFERLESIGVTL